MTRSGDKIHHRRTRLTPGGPQRTFAIMQKLRGTCVAIDGNGVLLRGPSGSGKSDLALRLIDDGAELVADDYTEVDLVEGQVIASAPAAIAGLLEVRGVAIVRLPRRSAVPLIAVIDIVPPETVERLPVAATVEIHGAVLSHFRLYPFEASAAAKVRLAARLAARGIMAMR
jgi:serine kinase of HPr protein (carbohydrate metabolism regulator)